MSGAEVLLRVEALQKTYAGREILNIDSLAFEPGKIYGVIGPSGAGKSTLLRLLNALDPFSAGRIYFGGEVVSYNGQLSPSCRRAMTLVAQKPVLFKTTVRENLAYGLKARGFKKEEIQRQVGDLLGRIGLASDANRPAHTLSGGEAQRVALARAVAFDPQLLLLDEPTANLDPGNVELMEQLILEMNRERQMTVIMVTHNIFQAKRIAAEVIFMHAGSVVERGTAEQIFTAPQNQLTKAFIEGRMVC